MKLGLSRSEATVYLALLKYPLSSANDISKRLGISRPRGYKILEHLETKQMVYVTNQKPKRYSAVPPHIATTILARKYEESFYEALRIRESFLNSLIENKILGSSSGKIPSMSHEVSDRHTLVNEIKEMIYRCDEELLIIGTQNELIRMVYLHKSEFNSVHEKGVSLYIMGPFNKIPRDILLEILKWGECRVAENVHVRTYISDRKEIIMIPSKGSIPERNKYDCGIYIYNSDIGKTMSELFFAKWNTLDPVG
jgi:sugar-specific transcriptional regulator TrmB